MFCYSELVQLYIYIYLFIYLFIILIVLYCIVFIDSLIHSDYILLYLYYSVACLLFCISLYIMLTYSISYMYNGSMERILNMKYQARKAVPSTDHRNLYVHKYTALIFTALCEKKRHWSFFNCRNTYIYVQPSQW
jgi:hypothetical protein